MTKKYTDGLYKGYLPGVKNLLKCGILKAISSGKTKKILIEKGSIDRDNESGDAIMYSTDDITAGDGAKKDIMVGKARSVIKTTYNIFKHLESQGISTSLVAADLKASPNALVVRNTKMIPLEVVFRNLAWGSYLKRNISAKQGDEINVFELFLKTNDKNWKGVIVQQDDPFIKVYDNEWQVVDPTKPTMQYFMMQPIVSKEQLETIEFMTRHINKILKSEFSKYYIDLIDFKVEFGFDPETGKILLSDEFSPDNMRLFHQTTGEQKDKDGFRDGSKSLDNLAKDYQMIAELTSKFKKIIKI